MDKFLEQLAEVLGASSKEIGNVYNILKDNTPNLYDKLVSEFVTYELLGRAYPVFLFCLLYFSS